MSQMAAAALNALLVGSVCGLGFMALHTVRAWPQVVNSQLAERDNFPLAAGGNDPS